MPGPFEPKLWIICTNTVSSEQKIGDSSDFSNSKRARAQDWNSFRSFDDVCVMSET